MPFQDLHGHLGHVAVLRGWGDPARGLTPYWEVDVRLIPSVLFDAMVYALGSVMTLHHAASLVITVFCIWGLPLSTAALLRVLGRDPWLALLILPLSYHRNLWYGFAAFCLSLTFLVLALALTIHLIDRTGRNRGSRGLDAVALAAASFLVALAHAFTALVLFGLVAVLWLLSPRRRRTAPLLLAALAPAVLLLARWLAAGGRSTSHELLFQILHAPHSITAAATLFHDWTANVYRGRLDEVVFIGALLSLLVVAGRLLVMRPDESEGARAPIELRPLGLLACVSLGLTLLPFELGEPYSWWGVSVRMVPLIWIFAIACLPGRRRLPTVWLALPLALSLWWSGFLVRDFRGWYATTEIAGLREAIARIPSGQRVLALFPNFQTQPHYTDYPSWFLPNLYLEDRGGMVFPAICERSIKEQWVDCKDTPPHPDWGRMSEFSFPQHVPHWDYFLFKHPAPGAPPERNLLEEGPPGAVDKVADFGPWSLYRRVGAAP